MGLSDIRDIEREDISEFFWKVRCKVLHKSDSPLNKPLDLDSTSEDDPKTTTPGKDPTFGADTTVKTLYEGRNSSPSHYEWVDYPPKQLSKSAARAQDRVAIKVYKIKDRDKPCVAGRFPLKYHSIEVQNPMLVGALESIMKKENVYLDVHDTAEFTEPFRPLWFCQDDIRDLYREVSPEDQLKGYLQLMLRVIDDMFGEIKTKRRHLLASGLIDFKSAWTLFPRGCTVYTYGLNSEFICKVEDTEYVKKNEGTFLLIKGKIMTFNGEEFIWQDKSLPIPAFAGNKPIRELRHYPFEFHSERDIIMKRLISRGKKVLDLQGLQYRCYNGIALHDGEKQCLEKHNVEGRVLIDVVGYNKYHLALGKRENKDPETERNQVRRARRRRPNDDDDDLNDAETKTEGNKSQKKRLTEKEQLKNTMEMMEREEDLGFMSDMIGGYALKNKLWVQFYIEDIEAMVWNDQAFDHLVYDDQQKDLVLSFVENHSLTNGSSNAMEDVIVGKGQGLIILLSGPPGTGKTLTAEAVADRTHRPLFYLQAEDLGINAATLGANIKRVFEMATEWNAVILLDEADVFMAERNPNDIHRNELVSIFLRELEYFRGIIFLTTNLYHTIDGAFRSRVSLHLLFQALNKEARETVWRKFLQRLPEQTFRVKDVTEGNEDDEDPKPVEKPLDEEDIAQLSLWQLNGREIKNAVKMVRNWCDHKGYVMTLARLESGIKVTSPHASKDGDVDEDLYE
ncbi:Fc.00g071610.m01.CDS01 [Cosmosporella sp. VM-42]